MNCPSVFLSSPKPLGLLSVLPRFLADTTTHSESSKVRVSPILATAEADWPVDDELPSLPLLLPLPRARTARPTRAMDDTRCLDRFMTWLPLSGGRLPERRTG